MPKTFSTCALASYGTDFFSVMIIFAVSICHQCAILKQYRSDSKIVLNVLLTSHFFLCLKCTRSVSAWACMRERERVSEREREREREREKERERERESTIYTCTDSHRIFQCFIWMFSFCHGVCTVGRLDIWKSNKHTYKKITQTIHTTMPGRADENVRSSVYSVGI